MDSKETIEISRAGICRVLSHCATDEEVHEILSDILMEAEKERAEAGDVEGHRQAAECGDQNSPLSRRSEQERRIGELLQVAFLASTSYGTTGNYDVIIRFRDRNQCIELHKILLEIDQRSVKGAETSGLPTR